MTDKEFKQLSRPQLIEIIYRLQLKLEELTEQNEILEQALEDKRLRINHAGNIAKAALEINDCFRSAQNAAEHYLNEIRVLYAEAQHDIRDMLAEAEEERDRILAEAQEEAFRILDNAQERDDHDRIVDAIMREFRHNRFSNG